MKTLTITSVENKNEGDLTIKWGIVLDIYACYNEKLNKYESSNHTIFEYK